MKTNKNGPVARKYVEEALRLLREEVVPGELPKVMNALQYGLDHPCDGFWTVQFSVRDVRRYRASGHARSAITNSYTARFDVPGQAKKRVYITAIPDFVSVTTPDGDVFGGYEFMSQKRTGRYDAVRLENLNEYLSTLGRE